jgi:AAHS family 4-hydroxybenzoate transporter-like MFS transporter
MQYSSRHPEAKTSVAADPAAAVDVGRLIDDGPWSGYQKWLVFLTALAVVFDGIDNQLLGIVIPTVMREWGVPRSAFAPIVSAGYLGMMIGGAVAGLTGDRFGRRASLLASVFLFGMMTVAAALADGLLALGVLRFLAGLGLGGALPNAAALAAEFVPVRRRPIAVTITIVCVPLGATLAGLLGIRALPAIGWRALFVLGGVVPIVSALIFYRLLPESPRYLARHPHRWPELLGSLRRMGHPLAAATTFQDSTEQPVARPSVRTLFEPVFRSDTIPLWGAFLSCLLAVYLGFSWLTTLITGAGFDPGTANTGITAFNLGGVGGALAGGVAIARFGSRMAMLVMTAVAIAGALALSSLTISPGESLVPLLALLTLTGATINGVQTTMYALAAHVYPSAVRATGVGTAVSFGRTGAILSGYAGAWALEFGHASFFGLIAASMTVTFVSLALVRKHVPRASHPIAV